MKLLNMSSLNNSYDRKHISSTDFQGSAGEWLKREYARQRKYNLAVGERFKMVFNSDTKKDEMISLGRYSYTKK